MGLENSPGHNSRVRIEEFLSSCNSWSFCINIISVSLCGRTQKEDHSHTFTWHSPPASSTCRHTPLHLVVSFSSSFSLVKGFHYVAPAELIAAPVSVPYAQIYIWFLLVNIVCTCMCVNVLTACLYVYSLHTKSPQKSVANGVMDGCTPPCRCLQLAPVLCKSNHCS